MNGNILRRRMINKPEDEESKYWLVSNGSSYLDTGYTPNIKTELEYKYYVTNIGQYGPYIGSAPGSKGDGFAIPFYRNSAKKISATRFNWLSDVSSTKLVNNTNYTVSAYRGNNNIIINGDIVGSLSAGANECTDTLVLYTYYGNPTSSSFTMKGGIQYFRIYENNVLIHNFIPKLINGVAGMYDTKTKRFCSSKTSTPFTLIEITNN